MRNILFLILFGIISLLAAEDNYIPTSQALPKGYEVISAPVTEEVSSTQEDHASTIMQWIIRSSILALIIYFSLRRRDKTQEKLEVVEDMQASVFHSQKVYEEKTMQEPKLFLFQYIKAQSVALKRFAILTSIIWIVMMSIQHRVAYWFQNRFDARDFNEYFVATYMPIIILYGIYWIMSGMKKDS